MKKTIRSIILALAITISATSQTFAGQAGTVVSNSANGITGGYAVENITVQDTPLSYYASDQTDIDLAAQFYKELSEAHSAGNRKLVFSHRFPDAQSAWIFSEKISQDCDIAALVVYYDDTYSVMVKPEQVTYLFRDKTEVNAALDSEYNSIGTADSMSESEKYDAIFDWIRTNIDTSTDIYNDNNLEGAVFRHKTDCYGFASIFREFCKRAGVDCAIVTGHINEGHAWNVVKINGTWYYSDVSHGIKLQTRDEMIARGYTFTN